MLDAVSIKNIDGGIALPKNYRIVPAELFQGPSEEARGNVSIDSAESLLNYVETHGSANSAVFAHASSSSITAVLDWHAQHGTAFEAGHGLHRIQFSLEKTSAYNDWTGVSGRAMGQRVFAEFIEEHLTDIVEPNAMDVLEAATNLQGKRNVEFASGVRLANGDQQIKWVETTEAKTSGDIKVPTQIKLRLPIYRGAEEETTFEFRTLLRYRITDGKLTFEIKMLGVEDIDALAFAAVSEAVASNLPSDTQFYLGRVTAHPTEILTTLIK